MAELAYVLLQIPVRSIRHSGGSKDRRQCVNSQTRISDGGGRKDSKEDVRVLVRNRKSCMQNQDQKKESKNAGR